MAGDVQLWCERCRDFTAHQGESGVNEYGTTWRRDRCGRCGATAEPFKGAHEAPLDVPQAEDDRALVVERHKHLRYWRWRVARGLTHDDDDTHMLNALRQIARERVEQARSKQG